VLLETTWLRGLRTSWLIVAIKYSWLLNTHKRV